MCGGWTSGDGRRHENVRHGGRTLQGKADGMVQSALDFIRHLMSKERETLGFLPISEIERRAALGRVELAYDNGDPCGYLVTGKGRGWLPIHQACVAADARLIDHGRRLVQAALE